MEKRIFYFSCETSEEAEEWHREVTCAHCWFSEHSPSWVFRWWSAPLGKATRGIRASWRAPPACRPWLRASASRPRQHSRAASNNNSQSPRQSVALAPPAPPTSARPTLPQRLCSQTCWRRLHSRPRELSCCPARRTVRCRRWQGSSTAATTRMSHGRRMLQTRAMSTRTDNRTSLTAKRGPLQRASHRCESGSTSTVRHTCASLHWWRAGRSPPPSLPRWGQGPTTRRAAPNGRRLTELARHRDRCLPALLRPPHYPQPGL